MIIRTGVVNGLRLSLKFSFKSYTTQQGFIFSKSFPDSLKQEFESSFLIYENFVSLTEEENLMAEFEPHLKRHLYEKDHWDNAISGFRETEKKLFDKRNSPIIQRIRDISFPSSGKESKILPYTHILDLAEDGFIKPHVDSIRFCGDRVAVVSLLSSSIGRFALEKDSSISVVVLIPRRSLYIMKGLSRYEFTHEILKNQESFLDGKFVEKSRRISIICRNEP
ncbi:alpha-ketoglutarate-dependent dioxygenase alkB homolog 7, mitochondrial [Eurytemora carolleeae]|uniref:alpha-ketoglutarate-dependent dioxygenase alkB homolog 7, mitochondrial n=1 Tax=Eurytemora carolleeae TaxID=1294199 RepID=UPI000C78363C|nr:alpha-ketoglutarate-dependent dioxygenase alkB homolog 7, mitochondrial [Eurytemora carolleeae]|eukprot:XP_023334732.1 alpha-ketoglutarate-dependent dioxygenase alkB homolog 7, mitochondrial-like [Eurytemora affinis]